MTLVPIIFPFSAHHPIIWCFGSKRNSVGISVFWQAYSVCAVFHLHDSAKSFLL